VRVPIIFTIIENESYMAGSSTIQKYPIPLEHLPIHEGVNNKCIDLSPGISES
jgi:hypothetical protein